MTFESSPAALVHEDHHHRPTSDQPPHPDTPSADSDTDSNNSTSNRGKTRTNGELHEPHNGSEEEEAAAAQRAEGEGTLLFAGYHSRLEIEHYAAVLRGKGYRVRETTVDRRVFEATFALPALWTVPPLSPADRQWIVTQTSLTLEQP